MTAPLRSMPMPATDVDSFFGDRLRACLQDAGRSQTWLGVEVGVLMGRQPYSQSAVSAWLLGSHEPEPQVVFAIERLLNLRPGKLSRHLGYLPLTVKDIPITTEAAINDDDRLTKSARRALLAAYRELRD